MQTLGAADYALANADFITNPRKVVHLDVSLFKPEAHGHLLKLSKVRPPILQCSVTITVRHGGRLQMPLHTQYLGWQLSTHCISPLCSAWASK